MCFHGLGLPHMLIDALMTLPFVASGIWFFILKIKTSRLERKNK